MGELGFAKPMSCSSFYSFSFTKQNRVVIGVNFSKICKVSSISANQKGREEFPTMSKSHLHYFNKMCQGKVDNPACAGRG